MKKETLSIRTKSRTDLVAITSEVRSAIKKMNISNGICTIYIPHTTAAILINEGYDPDVMRDVDTTLEKLIPWTAGYAHSEGNAAAHIKASIIGNSRQIIVENGSLLIGRWEEIFFAEFDGPRSRQYIVAVNEE